MYLSRGNLPNHRELGPNASPPCSSPEAWVAVRLVGGPGRCSGRVEVLVQDTWGTVCDDLWDLAEAAVVCRQLECGQAVAAPTRAHFGAGSGKIALDNMQCVGSESHLGQCVHGGEAGHNCGHLEDASVVCTGERLLSVPAWRAAPVVSLPTPTHTHTPQWHTHTPQPSLRTSVDQAGSLAPSQVVQPPNHPPSCSDC